MLKEEFPGNKLLVVSNSSGTGDDPGQKEVCATHSESTGLPCYDGTSDPARWVGLRHICLISWPHHTIHRRKAHRVPTHPFFHPSITPPHLSCPPPPLTQLLTHSPKTTRPPSFPKPSPSPSSPTPPKSPAVTPPSSATSSLIPPPASPTPRKSPSSATAYPQIS